MTELPKRHACYWDNCNVRVIKYCIDDKYHRIDGPAYMEFHPNGNLIWQKWYIDNVLHRDDGGPAEEEFYDIDHWYYYGKIKCMNWYFNGQLHNIDNPAVILFYASSKFEGKKYYTNGLLNRTDGPAVELFNNDDSNSIKRREYYINGQLHRTDGPAIEVYNDDGTIKNEKYYIDGTEVEKIEKSDMTN